MSKKKPGPDSLRRALDEAPTPKAQGAGAVPIQQPVEHARPVAEMLETLQAQTLEALSDPFFDGGTTAEMTPVTKRRLSEAGAVQIKAKRREPAVKATVTVDVRCDQDEAGDTGRYHVRAKGSVARETEHGDIDSEFSVSVEMRQDDGAVTLGAEQVRDEIANAIRSTGSPVD